MCLAYLGDSIYGDEENTADSIMDLYGRCFTEWGDAVKFVEKLEDLKEELGRDTLFNLQEIYQRILNYIGATEFEFRESQYYNFGMLSQIISDFEAIYRRIKSKDIKYFLGFVKFY